MNKEIALESLKNLFHKYQECFHEEDYEKTCRLLEYVSEKFILKGTTDAQKRAKKTYYYKNRQDPTFLAKRKINNRINFLTKTMKVRKLDHYVYLKYENEIKDLKRKKSKLSE